MNAPPTASTARFPLGQIVITPKALLSLTKEAIVAGILRHQSGDWGELDKDDRKENDLSLAKGFRLVSAYRNQDGLKFYVITEANRDVTTVLMPEDY